MPTESATAVAKEKIWKEHLDKCSNQERKHRKDIHTFSMNPFRAMQPNNRPLAEPCNKRQNRFLDRDKAALGAIIKQLGPEKARHLMDEPGEGSDGAITEYSIPQQRSNAGNDSLPPIHGAQRSEGGASQSLVGGEENVKKLLAMVTQTPVEKYDFPMTESQELGWMPPRQKAKADNRFRFGKKNCEVTKFASAVSISKNHGAAK